MLRASCKTLASGKPPLLRSSRATQLSRAHQPSQRSRTALRSTVDAVAAPRSTVRAKSKQQPIATRDGGDPAHPTPWLPGRPCRHFTNHVPPHPRAGAQARAGSVRDARLSRDPLARKPVQAFMPEQQQAPPPQDDEDEEEEEPEAPPPAPAEPAVKRRKVTPQDKPPNQGDVNLRLPLRRRAHEEVVFTIDEFRPQEIGPHARPLLHSGAWAHVRSGGAATGSCPCRCRT